MQESPIHSINDIYDTAASHTWSDFNVNPLSRRHYVSLPFKSETQTHRSYLRLPITLPSRQKSASPYKSLNHQKQQWLVSFAIPHDHKRRWFPHSHSAQIFKNRSRRSRRRVMKASLEGIKVWHSHNLVRYQLVHHWVTLYISILFSSSSYIVTLSLLRTSKICGKKGKSRYTLFDSHSFLNAILRWYVDDGYPAPATSRYIYMVFKGTLSSHPQWNSGNSIMRGRSIWGVAFEEKFITVARRGFPSEVEALVWVQFYFVENELRITLYKLYNEVSCSRKILTSKNIEQLTIQ